MENFIEGIHTDIGMLYAGKNLKSYQTILASYHQDMQERIEDLKAAYRQGDYHLFATYAHAMKSASAAIGATEVSEMAKTLELAGKADDILQIDETLPQFLVEFPKVIKYIGDYLYQINSECKSVGDKLEPYRNEVEDSLKKRLQAAIDDMDSIGAEEILKEINEHSYNAQIEYCIEKIQEEIGDYNYDNAMIYMKLLH